MAEVETHVGDRVSGATPILRADFFWSLDRASASGVDATTAQAALILDGGTVWAPHDELDWPWIELLEWFGHNWTKVTYEDGLPFKADPPTSRELLTHVERRSKYSPAPEAAELEWQLWEFLEAHDIARSMQGAQPPSLIVWREGLIGHALTSDTHVRCDWSELETALIGVAEQIAGRLRRIETKDRRSEIALRVWDRRDQVGVGAIVEAASGLGGERLSSIAALLDRRAVLSDFSPESVAHDEILAAARMTAGLPIDVIQEVLSLVVSLSRSSFDRLDEVALAVAGDASIEGRPYEQGHALGVALRAQMGLSDDRRFDPERWLEEHDVFTRDVALSTHDVDAIACWGANVGPAVLINERGKHSKNPAGRNASLAHEICHLLVDRAAALPAAEVMGGRINPAVEARARAFAAEVLLPRSAAGRAMATTENKTQVEQVVRSLTSRYRVSYEVVAWQARNSEYDLHPTAYDVLRRYVPPRWSF